MSRHRFTGPHPHKLLTRIKARLTEQWYSGTPGPWSTCAIHCAAKDIGPLLKATPPPPKRSYYGAPKEAYETHIIKHSSYANQ